MPGQPTTGATSSGAKGSGEKASSPVPSKLPEENATAWRRSTRESGKALQTVSFREQSPAGSAASAEKVSPLPAKVSQEKVTAWRSSTRAGGKSPQSSPTGEQPRILPSSILQKSLEGTNVSHVSPGATGVHLVHASNQVPAPEPSPRLPVIASSLANTSPSSTAHERLRAEDSPATRIPAVVDTHTGATQLAQYNPATGGNPFGASRPIVSPYLNLFRQGNSAAFNYHTLVRPELEIRKSIGQLQQQVAELPLQGAGAPAQEQGLPATGHTVGYMTHQRFFMTMGRGGAGTGRGVAAPQKITSPQKTGGTGGGRLR